MNKITIFFFYVIINVQVLNSDLPLHEGSSVNTLVMDCTLYVLLMVILYMFSLFHYLLISITPFASLHL